VTGRIPRRDFLKLGGLSLGALALPGPLRAARAPRVPPVAEFPQGEFLCRVTEIETTLRSAPRPDASEVGARRLDDVLVLQRQVVGEGVYPHNHVWYESPEGYLWSSEAQPVRNAVNQPEPAIPEDGLWTEVTIPYTEGRSQPDPSASVRYRLYYSMVLNVNQKVEGADGNPWYRVKDENGIVMFSPAEAFRVIQPEEIEPIGTGVEDKVLRVNLDRQDLSAVEDGVEVYYCRISSGYAFDREGKRVWNTPIGQNWTWRKMVSRHMSGGDLVSGYDLPGVGWTILFSGTGAAVHSTYWHNDFGTPRSRGCINVLPEDAKWLFRWSNPAVPYRPGDLTSLFPNPGTPVIVREA
jgi:hypothetical protein